MKSSKKLKDLLHQWKIPDIPEGATPVKDFDVNRYMGKWYEVARLNFMWERQNYSNVVVEYQLIKNNLIHIQYEVYDHLLEVWEKATAKARFRDDQKIGAFEISYFGMGWYPYNIIAVDDDYLFTMVVGNDTNHLWLLSRTTSLPSDIKDKYIKIANQLGYDTEEINWTDQSHHAKSN